MISYLFSRLIILVFGTLYPAYASFKAVKTKNVKEYMRWLIYWIVFALFTCIETCTDIFLSWLPLYYEVKVLIVFWLLSPATRGSLTLYRQCVHPILMRREDDIDEYLNQAKEHGYSAVLQLGSKGVKCATNVILQIAMAAAQYSRSYQLRKVTTSQSEGAIHPRTNPRNRVTPALHFDSSDDEEEFVEMPFAGHISGWSDIEVSEPIPYTKDFNNKAMGKTALQTRQR